MSTPGATPGKFWNTVYDGICASLREFFCHFEHIASTSEDWLNSKSVIEVVRFIKVLNGLSSRSPVSPEILNRLTDPIFDPEASNYPFGLTASFIVEKPPVSATLPMHFLVPMSH